MAVVYKITNVITNKVYIGQTIRSPYQRKCEHFWHLEHNSHKSKKLQNSYNKWGKTNFIFEVLWEGPDEERGTKEIEFISQYDSFSNGYNMTPGGEININGTKQIFVYDEEGNFLTSFYSLSEAARQLGSSPSNIYQALYHYNNRRSVIDDSGQKFQFSYEGLDQLPPIRKIVYHGNQTEVRRYDNNELLGVYTSTRQAALDHGVSESHAQAIARGEKNKGFSKKIQDYVYFKRLNR